jgi:hypothetical protein
VLDSQHGRSEAELRGLALAAIGAATMALMQSVMARRSEAVVDALSRFADLVGRGLASPSGQEWFVALSYYLLRASVMAPLADALERNVGSEAERIMRSTADRLRAEGRAEGGAEGKAEGITEGRAAMLLRLLTARFGEQPDAVRLRLSAATIDQLDRWAERVLDARTVDDVFADG